MSVEPSSVQRKSYLESGRNYLFSFSLKGGRLIHSFPMHFCEHLLWRSLKLWKNLSCPIISRCVRKRILRRNWLTISCIILKNCQTYFENLPVFTYLYASCIAILEILSKLPRKHPCWSSPQSSCRKKIKNLTWTCNSTNLPLSF